MDKMYLEKEDKNKDNHNNLDYRTEVTFEPREIEELEKAFITIFTTNK